MIIIGTRAKAAARRREAPIGDAVFYRSEWMEHGRDTQLAPNVILVEQPPNATLVSHFHQTNQFQLFVEGSGTIGPHVIKPCMIHYAGAFTGYGPLVAGPRGIKYLTLRPAWDSGFIPSTDRQRMLRGPKRHAESEIFAPLAARTADVAGNESTVRPLIPTGPDGLGATLICLGADTPLRIVHAPGSRGQFIVVLQGSVQYGETELGLWESLYVHEDEPPLQLRAGAQGAEVVAMHMPKMEPAYDPGSSLPQAE